jgi:hypothetical protein
MQNTEFQKSEFTIQRSAFGVQRLAFSVWRSAFGVHRLAFGVRRAFELPASVKICGICGSGFPLLQSVALVHSPIHFANAFAQ